MSIDYRSLGYISEKALEREASDLQRKIRSMKFSDKRRAKLEIKFCYIFRELETRRARKVAHQKYMQKKNAKRNHFNRDNRANQR